jgi:hypothetical protein
MRHNGIATSRRKTTPRQNPPGATGPLRAQKKCHTVQSLLRANSLKTNKSDTKEVSHFLKALKPLAASGTDRSVCATQTVTTKWDTVPPSFTRISLKTKNPSTAKVGHFLDVPKPLALDTSLLKLHLSAPDAKFHFGD